MTTAELIASDKRHCWHPFTQQRDWCAPENEPLVLVEGRGALLKDSEGREYIDGNSSIWTNIHGHAHPKINAAICEQLEKVAHTSFLGFTNPQAILLAEELVALWPQDVERPLTRVFFGDDGSTAIECAIKMAVQCWQHRGEPRRKLFVSFANAYHGDTMGASSLGGINVFHGRFSSFQFPCEHVASLDELIARTEPGAADGIDPSTVAAVVIEPLIQGAAGMRLWPAGMLAQLRAWCDHHGVFLICDEVMTGFGRTGKMFASQQENVVPDFVACAKGLSGGYLPVCATYTTEAVYEAFLGDYTEAKSFFYGHSFTGSQVGCAAARASLAIFREEHTLEQLAPKIELFSQCLAELEKHPHVGAIRQCGFIAGIDVVDDEGKPYGPEGQVGARVCVAARKHGLLTRPVTGNTLVLMPPYCISEAQLRQAVDALARGIEEVCGK